MLVCSEGLWEAWSPPECPQFPDLTSRICPAQGPTILFTVMNQRPALGPRKHLACLSEQSPIDDTWSSFLVTWKTAVPPWALCTWAAALWLRVVGLFWGDRVAQWTDYLQGWGSLFWSFWSQHLAQGTQDPRTIHGKSEGRPEGRKFPQKSFLMLEPNPTTISSSHVLCSLLFFPSSI